jgi:hypothetical protein
MASPMLPQPTVATLWLARKKAEREMDRILE